MLRLNKGEQLVACLTDFIHEQGIAGGWVSGIGGALAVELGFYDLMAQHYRWKQFKELLEITSLQGNVAWSGEEPFLHLHGTFSGADMQTIGGHVKELTIGGTGEIFLHVWNKDRLRRAPDDETGLKLLDL